MSHEEIDMGHDDCEICNKARLRVKAEKIAQKFVEHVWAIDSEDGDDCRHDRIFVYCEECLADIIVEIMREGADE